MQIGWGNNLVALRRIRHVNVLDRPEEELDVSVEVSAYLLESVFVRRQLHISRQVHHLRVLKLGLNLRLICSGHADGRGLTREVVALLGVLFVGKWVRLVADRHSRGVDHSRLLKRVHCEGQ